MKQKLPVEKWPAEAALTLYAYSEQERTDETAHASELRFRALVESTIDIVGIISDKRKIEYLSPSINVILGYAKQALEGLDMGMLVHPNDRSDFDDFISLVLARPGILISSGFRAQHTDGSWRRLEGSANNLIHLPGVKGIVINLRDVTEQKLLEEDLQQKKYFLEKAQETAKVGYWISEPSIQNAALKWSKETCRIFGLREHEFDRRVETYFRFIHPDDRAKVMELAQKAIAGEAVYNIDHRIQLMNGNVRWVHEQAEIVRDEQGRAQRIIGIVQDITERKVIEEVLKEYNERYELWSKATNDAIWDWDVALGLLTWNHGLQTIFGYQEKDVDFTFSWWLERVHPEDRHELDSSISKSLAGKQNNWSHTYRFREAGGGYKYVYDRAYIIYDEEHKPVRMIGAMQDISERMRALEEIEKLSFVASKTDNAVVITDALQCVEWVNESFVRMTGYTLEEVKGRKSDFLYSPGLNAGVMQKMHERIALGLSFSGELVSYAKTGRKYWLKLEVAPVFSDNGGLKNLITIQSDITQEKESESRITAVVKELSSLIENANVPIFGIDCNGCINEWNKVSAELSGISRAELMGRRWIDEFVGADHREAAENMLASVLRGSSVSNFELPVFTKNKKLVILLLSASPRRDEEKAINGAILVAQDITELIDYRRNLEMMVQDRTRELNEALQKEKELVDLKSRFVSIASHEFRTPLSTITLATGYLKKFKHKLTPEEIDDKLANIERQVSHMTHLLDDVLMIGKGEAGKIPVRLVTINVPEFFESLCREVEQSTAKTHSIRLTHRLQIPIMLSDEKLLRNIFINTLTNAIKFSPYARYVDLTLTGDAKKVSLQVRDYGIGIPAEDMEQLFEPFHRGSNANTIQGTGLGLSIMKKGVDLLRGFIDVKSEVGAGTTLTITLPLLHE